MGDVKQRWSSRKFISAMFWEAVFTVLLLHGTLDKSIYFNLTILTLGGYFASNLAATKLKSPGN